MPTRRSSNSLPQTLTVIVAQVLGGAGAGGTAAYFMGSSNGESAEYKMLSGKIDGVKESIEKLERQYEPIRLDTVTLSGKVAALEAVRDSHSQSIRALQDQVESLRDRNSP